jgi:Ser-tRNA(Ala) deacylase AlaX
MRVVVRSVKIESEESTVKTIFFATTCGDIGARGWVRERGGAIALVNVAIDHENSIHHTAMMSPVKLAQQSDGLVHTGTR